MTTDYVLGNDQEELDRLKLQHDLWQAELIKLWDNSKLKTSAHVLDLGCGPGFTSLDIIHYNSANCNLTSVDFSENFLKYLRFQMSQNNFKNSISTLRANVEELQLENSPVFDVAFCRWLMIFVQNPAKAIQSISKYLRSGSEFIIQEYVSYDSMDLVPNYSHIKPVVEAIFKSWREQGGDPNRGKILPKLLVDAGFKITHLEPIAKFAQPRDPLWQWPESFYLSFLPRLQKNGYLSEKQVSDFFAEWNHAKQSPGSYFVCPTVINIIAQKN